MLLLLVVENYAVVSVCASFSPGAEFADGGNRQRQIDCGGCFGAAAGGRASADMIRTGEPQARVAGIFDVRENGAVRKILEPAGLETEDGELLIEREILASGKSRAFVGSRPVAAALLRELAPRLADIHGQHEQQLLFSADAQRDLLDAFAGNAELVEQAAEAFGGWRAAAAGLEELESSEQEKLRALDLWTFERRDIENASVQPEEDAALERERRVLQNVQRLEEARPQPTPRCTTARNRRWRWRARLPGASTSCAASTIARGPARAPEGRRSELAGSRLWAARLSFEVGGESAAAGGSGSAPGSARPLKRKYGATLTAVIEFLEEVRRQIAAVENAGERMEELRREQARLAAEFESGRLS